MILALLILIALNLAFLAGCWWASRGRNEREAELFVEAYDLGFDDAMSRLSQGISLPHRVAQRRAARDGLQ